jgi:hypothetical protein
VTARQSTAAGRGGHLSAAHAQQRATRPSAAAVRHIEHTEILHAEVVNHQYAVTIMPNGFRTPVK